MTIPRVRKAVIVSKRTIPPVRKAVIVPWTPEEAFRRFTEGMSDWWPLGTHAVDPDRAETCVFEGRIGGRIYEARHDGSEADWGTVTAWEPPTRVAFTWHPGRDPSTAQEVEVVFTRAKNGSRVELIHRGWERYGSDAENVRDEYDSGWEYVLSHYGQT